MKSKDVIVIKKVVIAVAGQQVANVVNHVFAMNAVKIVAKYLAL